MATTDEKVDSGFQSSSEEKAILVEALVNLTEVLESCTIRCEESFQKSVSIEDFVKISADRMAKPSHMFYANLPILGAYAECMSRLSVKTKRELDEIFNRHSQDQEVTTRLGDLTAAEEKYESLMARIHQVVVESENKAAFLEITTVGKILPQNIALVEAKLGETVSLESYWKKSKYTLFIFMRHLG